MLVIVKILNQENFPDQINLSDQGLEVSYEEKKVPLDSTKEERFATLCSLFSLKENWKSESNKDAKYQIYFRNETEEEIFFFNDTVPENFLTFLTYVYKIVGDYHG